MKIFYTILVLMIAVAACKEQREKSAATIIRADKAWLDSVIKNSDSSYEKPYRRNDFVTASFFINKKDSSVCQVMKDSFHVIRQIIVAKNNNRTFFAQYYSNGQLQAELPLDEFGQYHGKVRNYYEDGHIQSSGNYLHGLKSGRWENFDQMGKLISTDEYDVNGQLITTTKQ